MRRKASRLPFFKSNANTFPPKQGLGGSGRSVSPTDELLADQLGDLRKELRKERQIRMVDRMTSPMKKLFPSGIRYPDDVVQNKHLYTGGRGKAHL